MKKRILIILSVVALALSLTALLVACGKTATVDYVVTVLSPDEKPIEGVTVTWMNDDKAAGSAKTDADGVATAKLAAGTYKVTLADYGEGLAYTDIPPVGSVMRNLTVTLGVAKMDYTVTVLDKTGAPAAGVDVTWTNGSKIAGENKTNENGIAVSNMYYGEYIVTLSNLPEGNVYDGAQTVSGKNPDAQFNLRDGVTVRYTVTVRSAGGLLFKEHTVTVRSGNTTIASGKTNDEGVYSFNAVAGNYRVLTSEVPNGYNQTQLNLTSSKRIGDLVLTSEVITAAPANDTTYVIGDIIHNYEFATTYELGSSVWKSTVSEILENKEALIINNWGTNCSWCVTEMPDMQEVYEKYSDQIEIVAVSNYSPRDTDRDIENYYATTGYTFPMMRDLNGFASKFSVSGWPTTVIIDRYGAVARIESGAITSAEAWERMILKYIGPDYVQTFTPGEHVSDSINTEIAKPDVEIAPDHYEKLTQTLNKTETFPESASVLWYGETDEEQYAWPYMYGTVEGVSPDDAVVYASNSGKANSWAVLYATVTVEAGKVFTFDYWSDTEDDDVLSIIWDGKIIKEIYGNSGGWQTCYLFADLTDGSHNVAFVYQKDSSVNKGKDNVYLRNVRFSDVADIDQPTDMFRGAAYGTVNQTTNKFEYYASVTIEADGYYHVNLSSLHNSELAGTDESPLLMVNLLNVTSWHNQYSLATLILGIDEKTEEYLFDCVLTVNGKTRDYRADLTEYLSAATASDVEDCVPVDEYLHDMLVEFMKKVSGSNSHPAEWLEACYFYSHYGSDSGFVGNPILGLMTKTAIPVEEGTEYTANLTRNMSPFPTMKYTFTPETSAVYKIESLIPEKDNGKYAAQAWLYDDESSASKPIVYCGDTRVTIDGVNEHNFVIYRYLTAGHKYYIEVAFQMADSGTYNFKITDMGQSVTELIPCSEDLYDMVIDENDNITGETVLAGAIDFIMGEDNYYHVKNADGTAGELIYLDVLHANSSALGNIPLYKLIDAYCTDPQSYKKLDYTVFDFRYCTVFYNLKDDKGNDYIGYEPKADITGSGEQYKDYTEILRAYFEAAPAEGKLKGLIPVNKELVDILLMFFELRCNGVYDGKFEEAQANEWLRFCWYERTYNSENP